MSAAPVGSRRLVRYRFAERLTHAVAAVSYVYLLLTGLAFWTPALFWVAVVLGGGYLSRALHPWAGLVLSGAVVLMFVHWRRDMRTSPADRAWRQAMRHYVRNEDDRVPGVGKFNYGQKMLFWLMMWGTVALLLSGAVLWFPESFGGSLTAIREAALLIHAVAALATIGAFIVHVYMGVAVVPGGVNAIVHGEVSEAWARQHHTVWAEEMTSHPSSASPRADTPR
ncbi:MAG: formate dehydrogenase subunit gamma [Acidobacteriota bacterium]